MERANQEVQIYLRVFVSYNQHDGADYLLVAQVAINNRNVIVLGVVSPVFNSHGNHVSSIQNLSQDSIFPISTRKGRLE